jgi:hypothetical protein
MITGIDFQRRSNRRLACVATYAGYALTVLALWQGTPLAAVPAGLLSILGWWVLNQVAVPYSKKDLDERELQVRNQAFFRSYQCVAGATALALLYVQFALDLPGRLWLPGRPGEIQALVWGYLLVAITLPHAVIAWQDPDYE